MIQVRGLTKRFGPVVAVEDLSFDVLPGRVTAFLGPNGAGKSTTMRMILGLDRPTAGAATVHGRPFVDFSCPMREVGALLEAGAFDHRLGARSHLRWLARAGGVPRERVDVVLDLVDLVGLAGTGQRVGEFSLGMRQRLGLAAALLGDPPVLLLDEPTNGLDPQGIVWMRTLLRELAAEGRTVLVSSHLMGEVQQTADRVVVLGRGRLVADVDVAELTADGAVRVVSPDSARLASVLTAAGAEVRADGACALSVRHLPANEVGRLAASSGVVLHELSPPASSLEAAFMDLTRHRVVHRTDEGSGP